MQIFLDTGSVKEVERAAAFGVLDGVTTNPSLIAKEGKDFHQTIKVICKIVNGPVSAEVVNTNTEGMIKEAKQLVKLGKNVVVKIPLIPEGIKAVKQLSKQGIKVNVTLCFSPNQALLAAKAGAKYVSPFAGRIDDMLRTNMKVKFDKSDYYPAEGMDDMEDNGIVSGIDLVRQCVDVLRYYEMKTEVLAASLRNPRQVREAALAGADIATLPFSVIQKLLSHRKTYEGMESFTKDIVPGYKQLIDRIKS